MALRAEICSSFWGKAAPLQRVKFTSTRGRASRIDHGAEGQSVIPVGGVSWNGSYPDLPADRVLGIRDTPQCDEGVGAIVTPCMPAVAVARSRGSFVRR